MTFLYRRPGPQNFRKILGAGRPRLLYERNQPADSHLSTSPQRSQHEVRAEVTDSQTSQREVPAEVTDSQTSQREVPAEVTASQVSHSGNLMQEVPVSPTTNYPCNTLQAELPGASARSGQARCTCHRLPHRSELCKVAHRRSGLNFIKRVLLIAMFHSTAAAFMANGWEAVRLRPLEVLRDGYDDVLSRLRKVEFSALWVDILDSRQFAGAERTNHVCNRIRVLMGWADRTVSMATRGIPAAPVASRPQSH